MKNPGVVSIIGKVVDIIPGTASHFQLQRMYGREVIWTRLATYKKENP